MRGEGGTGWPSRCTRVVLVDPRVFGMGGRETVVRNLADALTQIGVDVDIVSVFPGEAQGRYVPRVIFSDERLYRSPVMRRGDLSLAAKLIRVPLVVLKHGKIWWERRRFRRWFETLKDETVVVFTHPLGRQVLRESGYRRNGRNPPIFVGQHHMSFESLKGLPSDASAIAREYTEIDVFTALSREDADSFRGMLGVPSRCVPNCYREVASTPGRPARPTRRAVALARYSVEKRLDMMIRAFAAAVAQGANADWRLDLYGEGEQGKALSDLIVALGVGDQVSLHTRTDDVGSVLASSDLLLLTSVTEGLPLSVMEAAQYGVPALVTDCGYGLRELIKQLDGILVPLSVGEAGYAAALAEAMADPESLRERGEAAARGVVMYSPRAVIDVWADVIHSAYTMRGV